MLCAGNVNDILGLYLCDLLRRHHIAPDTDLSPWRRSFVRSLRAFTRRQHRSPGEARWRPLVSAPPHTAAVTHTQSPWEMGYNTTGQLQAGHIKKYMLNNVNQNLHFFYLPFRYDEIKYIQVSTDIQINNS